jgi:hypothetical protein
MSAFSSRAGRAVLAFTIVALGACADQQSATEASPHGRASFSAGDVFVVTNTSGGNVAGSLRSLVNQATGGEVIHFDASLAGKTITLDTTLEIPTRVTIEGPADKGITISGGGNAMVLNVHNGATLVNLTITGGKASGNAVAGGILATGPLVLDHSTVSGNQGIDGGGIRGDTITLINSTVANNSVPSTFNVVGGVNFNLKGSLTLINSTVARNTGGTGIGPFGETQFTPKVIIRNSIISNNAQQNCLLGHIGFSYEGKNIFDDKSCGTDALLILVADPLLGTLADNGGPTQTLALDRNSPAINATDCTVTVDQRYVARDTKCDIGAFEYVFTTVSLTIDPRPLVDPATGVAVISGTVLCSRSETLDLAVNLQQGQRVKRAGTSVQATQTVPVVCGTTKQPWIASLAPASGQAFVNGDALAAVQVVNVPNGVTPAVDSSAVQLFWGKK